MMAVGAKAAVVLTQAIDDTVAEELLGDGDLEGHPC